MILEKPKREKDAAYLEFIRQQPCLVCGETEGIDAHHVLERGQGKVGSKADDRRSVSLCREAHQQYHQLGRARFEEMHGLDLEVEIQRLNRLYRPIAKQKREPGIKARVEISHCPCRKVHKLPPSKVDVSGAVVRFQCPKTNEWQEAK